MRAIILTIFAIMLFGTCRSQTPGQLKKIDKLINKGRLTAFISEDVNDINTITVMSSGGRLERLIVPHMKRALLKRRIRTLSERAVENRLIEIDRKGSSITINGPSKVIKSNLVLTILVDDFTGFMDVEVIDLSKDGEIVGTVTFASGLFNPTTVGHGLIIALLKELKQKH